LVEARDVGQVRLVRRGDRQAELAALDADDQRQDIVLQAMLAR
jgi:hypothetical protein